MVNKIELEKMEKTTTKINKKHIISAAENIIKDPTWRSKYLSPQEAREMFYVCNSTLRNWANAGFIKWIKTDRKGTRLYDKNSLMIHIDKKKKIKRRKKAVYLRISKIKNAKLKMKKIKELYHSKYPKHIIYSESESSNNWNRPVFNKIMSDVIGGEIEKLVVTDTKNLWRHGNEFFIRLFKKCNVDLIVDNGKSIVNKSQLQKIEC